MKGPLAPRIWEFFHHIWFALALLLLLAFVFRITVYTAAFYGALPAAVVFLALALMVLYTILYATSQVSRDRDLRF